MLSVEPELSELRSHLITKLVGYFRSSLYSSRSEPVAVKLMYGTVKAYGFANVLAREISNVSALEESISFPPAVWRVYVLVDGISYQCGKR